MNNNILPNLTKNQVKNFLLKHNFINNLQNFEFIKIAGDASFRSYYRIIVNYNNTQKQNFVLMFAPPHFERTDHFILIANFLQQNSLNSPQIFATNIEEGLILLQDFGDDSLNLFLEKQKNCNNYAQIEQKYYCKAIDELIAIGKIDHKNLTANYYNAELLRESMLFIEWYLPYKNITINQNLVANFKKIMLNLFDFLNKNYQTLVLRDFHADNLMICSNNKIGLLDFQDALIGNVAYDLVSLLEDARRDVEFNTKKVAFDYFASGFSHKISTEIIAKDYAILSLQRNLKILGIFCRLAIRDNKAHYLQYLPRVEKFITTRFEQKLCPFSNISLSFLNEANQFLLQFFLKNF